MKINKCKYCNSENLILENKSKLDIMQAPQVALKCANCGKWLKRCPKEERQLYVDSPDYAYREYQELCRLEEYERWADAEITDLNKQVAVKNKRIADLEAKLAEHEKRANKNFDAYMRCSKKYTELKQQLADKKQQLSDRETKWAI